MNGNLKKPENSPLPPLLIEMSEAEARQLFSALSGVYPITKELRNTLAFYLAGKLG